MEEGKEGENDKAWDRGIIWSIIREIDEEKIYSQGKILLKIELIEDVCSKDILKKRWLKSWCKRR